MQANADTTQLRTAMAALEAQRSLLGDAVVDAALTAMRAQLDAQHPPRAAEQQRKQATVLFADVVGFTTLSETKDAEEVTELINALWARLDGLVAAYGGRIDKHIGDAVMALWGVESAREDDPEQGRAEFDHFMDFGADKRFWYGSKSGTGAPCSPIRFAGNPKGTCAEGMPMYSESKTTGFNLKADVQLSQQDLLRVGGQFQSYQLDDWWPASGGGMGPGTFDNINDGKRDRTALFGEWESRINPQWMSLLGVRYERVESDAGDVRGYNTAVSAMGSQYADATAFNAQEHARNDNNWDLTALARYTANVNTDIEFGFARKVRSPNLYERYTWSTWSMAAVMNNFVGDGNGYIGNIDLEPEKAHTLSATFDWHAADRNWWLKATPYYTEVTDYIDAIRCTSGAACTPVSYTHLRAHETVLDLVCRLLLEKKKTTITISDSSTLN